MMRVFYVVLFLILSQQQRVLAWVFQPLEKITKDYQALTRRVTARHILLPSAEACIALKQKI